MMGQRGEMLVVYKQDCSQAREKSINSKNAFSVLAFGFYFPNDVVCLRNELKKQAEFSWRKICGADDGALISFIYHPTTRCFRRFVKPGETSNETEARQQN
jgi:hypothetical protein